MMKLKIALLLTVVSIGLHAYLTLHYYDLNYGMGAAESVCNISEKLNCDAVAASKYSTLFGTPVALWGTVTNIIMMILLLGWMLGWTNDIARLSRYSLWFAGIITAASVVMGSISLFAMSVFCIFCISAYIISFVNLYLIFSAQNEETHRPSGEYVRELFTTERIYLAFLLAVPLVSLFANYSMISKEGPKALQRLAKRVVEEWKVSPTISFASAPVLVKGATDAAAAVIVSEFADFRCGHCKTAVGTVDAFLSSRPDVQMRFYSFPLDKTCNDSAMGENGISCVLAKAVVCAEETGKKGWDMHSRLFSKQEDFLAGSMTVDTAKLKVNEYADEFQVGGEKFKSCLDSPELQERIKKMAKEAADSGVNGTPTFYINNKKLEAGGVLPVLDAAYAAAKSQSVKAQ